MMRDRKGKLLSLFPAAGISQFRPRQSLVEGNLKASEIAWLGRLSWERHDAMRLGLSQQNQKKV